MTTDTDDQNVTPLDADAPGLEGDALEARLERAEARGDRTPELLRSVHNLSVILRESAYWKGCIRRNWLTGMDEVWGGPCFEGRGLPFEMKDTDASEIRLWIARKFHCEFQKLAVDEVLTMAATDSGYDPLKDYLAGLEWDGDPRLDTMLERLFKASTAAPDGRDRAAYVRGVSAKWMIGAVARALVPGEQVDSMLVLQGPTGVRKSTAARVLGGPFFVDFDYSLESNDARTACGENWIAEMGELATMGKHRRELVKQFLTKTADKFRAPYDRRQENHPRRIVFIGTTNEDEVFTDETGNRRYWPVTITGNIDTEALVAERDQLWAEAVVRFAAGEKWHLTAEEDAAAGLEQAERMQSDAYSDRISDYFLRMEPAARPRDIRIVDVLELVMNEDGAPDRRTEMRVADSLKRLGFEKRNSMRDGVRANRWFTPEGLLGGAKQATNLRSGTFAGVPARA